MRWRVGRKPTWRSMVFTSCQGQPVSSERAAVLAELPGIHRIERNEWCARFS